MSEDQDDPRPIRMTVAVCEHFLRQGMSGPELLQLIIHCRLESLSRIRAQQAARVKRAREKRKAAKEGDTAC